jgi:hypothetical protein
MTSVRIFLFCLIIFVGINLFMEAYLNTSYETKLPDTPKTPSLFNYFEIFGQYFIFFMKLCFYIIPGVPVWLSIICSIFNLIMILIMIMILRGN